MNIRFPDAVIRSRSRLLVRKLRDCASVVPIKFVEGLVHEFQSVDQNEPERAVASTDQEASPVESLVSTFQRPGDPPVILICQATSSFAHGEFVPIPTSPEVVTTIF